MSTRPVVGITTYETDASWGTWHRSAALLPTTYIRSMERAGGIPLLVPVTGNAPEVIERLDALILSGGPDVDPALYGASRDTRTMTASGARDSSEIALLDAAMAAGKPILAICRGMQLFNVARGGSLHQHLPDTVGSDLHDPGPGEFSSHDVQVDASSLLAGALGSTRPTVFCHHHQGVHRLGEGLRAVATDADGTIEALEDVERAPIVAVQWHPEEDERSMLFHWLVEAATTYAT